MACERYTEIQEELSGTKGRSEREIQNLKEHLSLAMAALQEGQKLGNSLDHWDSEALVRPAGFYLWLIWLDHRDWITEMYAEAKATTAGLVQFWLCGDHNSALVLNHPVMKPCKLAISWVSALHWASFELGKCTFGFYHSVHLLLVWVQLLGLKTGLFVFIWSWSVHAVILCRIKQRSTVTDFFYSNSICFCRNGS